MDDADPLRIPLGSGLSSDSNDFRDPLAASSSGVRTKIEDALSDDLCVGTAGGGLLSKSYGDDSQDACMYMENNLNSEHDGLDINDDEDDEGLYLAINSMPVKVEIEEATNFDGVKHEVDDFDYSRDTLDESSLLQEEEGTASASWYDTGYMVDDVQLEQVDPTMPKHRKRSKQRSYLRGEERRERERLARRRLMAKERAKKYRNSLTEDQLEALREKDRERTKRRRMMMTEDECLLVRIKNRENAQLRRMDAKETRCQTKTIEGLDSDEEKALIIREKNRERMRLKRLNMTEEEKIIERRKNRERVRKRRQILKAEALLKKLINAHTDMVKQNTVDENKHFLQSLMDKNQGEIGPKMSE